MKKLLIITAFFAVTGSAFAQNKPTTPAQMQFIFIIRSKTDLSAYSSEAIQTNIKHWQAYMGKLAQGGKIAGGYHPASEGDLFGSNKQVKSGAYVANGESVSSFVIINATSKEE